MGRKKDTWISPGLREQSEAFDRARNYTRASSSSDHPTSAESMEQSDSSRSSCPASKSSSSRSSTPAPRNPSPIDREHVKRIEAENRQLKERIQEMQKKMDEYSAAGEKRHQQLMEQIIALHQNRAPNDDEYSVMPPAKSPASMGAPAPVVKPAVNAAEAAAGGTAAPARSPSGAGAAMDTADRQVSKGKKPFSGNTSEEEEGERTKQARREKIPEPRPTTREAKIPPVILRGKEPLTKTAALLKEKNELRGSRQAQASPGPCLRGGNRPNGWRKPGGSDQRAGQGPTGLRRPDGICS